ncbi:GtrA family protein [Paraburkholderia piptadeniae]|nr:GtrA family protein [Paraburkholderia piptadeniae]
MKLFRHSSVRYALVGVSNSAVRFAVIWLTLRGFGLDDVAANVSGYAVGFLWSFALNRAWTFRHHGPAGSGLLRYAVLCLLAYGANLLIVAWLGGQLGHGKLIVQICGVLTYTVFAYAGSRLYAFPPDRIPTPE